MEHDEKNQSPYKGFGVQCFFLILVPVACFVLFYALINEWQPEFPQRQNFITALIFSLIIGVLFFLSCAIAGAFKKGVNAVKERLKDFVDNIHLSFGFAVKNYFQDMKSGGVTFLISFLILITQVTLLVVALSEYLTVFMK